MKAPLAPNEAQRLHALRQYAVLDTPAERSFDDLAQPAAHICQTPIALIVLVDESRQWFKAKVGMEATETSRDIAFCAHTILNTNEVMEVPDASLDPRFFDNPLVTSDPHIRFYAGVALVTQDGEALGSLCVIDRSPQRLTGDQLSALATLARQTIAQLELRRHARELAKEVAENQSIRTLLQHRLDELSASKRETDRLLALGERSRYALLSVLEDEKQTGENLRASEASLASAQQRAKIGSWELRLADKNLFWSAEMFRLFAHDPALGIMGNEQFMAMIHPEDRNNIRSNLANALAERREFLQEFRIILPDGNVRWIESRGELTYNGAKEAVSLIGTSQDVTERKKAETLLLKDNQVLQMIASGAQLLEVLGAIVMSIESASHTALCSILLMDNDGIHLRHGAAPSLPEDYNQAIDGVAIGENIGSCGTAAHLKESVIVSDIANDSRWINYRELALKHGLRACWSVPIKGANDRVLGTFAMYYREPRSPEAFDLKLIESATNQAKIVIERKQAEAALQRSTLLLEASQTTAKVGGWELDLDSGQLFWTDETYRLHETTREEFHPTVDAGIEAYLPESRRIISAALQAAIERGEGYDLVLETLTARGRRIDVRATCTVTLQAGRPTKLTGIFQDITEHKQMEEQLRQTAIDLEQRVIERTQELQEAQISKTRFFAAASHDLLQPLNAARIFASTLAEQHGLSDLSMHAVQRIDRALHDAEEIIDVLVGVAKLDTGAVRTVIEDIDLQEILVGIADQFSPIAEHRNLQLRVGPCKFIVRSDRRLLRRILQNLLSNALRYTATGGVLIGVRRLGGAQIRIDVVDTGPGIHDEALTHIFEEFRRGGHISPWGEKGLGLGLAISKRICDLLGHKLSIKSTHGRGSTFSLTLSSFGNGGDTVSKTLPKANQQFGISRIKVLCVDDNTEVLDAMLMLLRSWDVACESANARSTALEAARVSRPDVLIVDFQFDDAESGDGLQIIRAVQNMYPAFPPAAIMITANRSDELKAIAKHLGIPLLNKPLRAARLRALLESISRTYNSQILQTTDDFNH